MQPGQPLFRDPHAPRINAHNGPRIFAFVAAIACAAFAAFATTAQAVDAPTTTATSSRGADMTVTDVDTRKFPYVRVAFVLDSDEQQLPSVSIDENGQHISNVNAYNGKPGRYDRNPDPVLILVLDASNTMRGAKFEQAKTAAKALIDQSRKGDRIGLVSFGAKARMVLKPTEDHAALKAEIDAVKITQGTAMHDAVKLASKSFPEDASRQMMVLLADGQDLGSKITLAEATSAAKEHQAEVYSVGIQGSVFFPEPLGKLAQSTGGEFQSVARASDLSRVYSALGRQLLRGYWLEYRSSQGGGTDVKVLIGAEGFDSTVHSYTTPAVKGKDGAITISPLPESTPQQPMVKLPGGQLGIMIAAVPFALILAFLTWIYLQKKSRPNLAARLEPYTRRTSLKITAGKDKAKRADTLMAPLYKLTESVLGKTSMFKRFRFLLEQANLPLREVELMYVMFGGAAIGGLLGLIIGHSLIAMAIVTPVGFMLPYMYVKFKAGRRKKKFENQLADVLNTIAASLKAGHSFNQSINAIIKETPDPTSHEFQRVMTESRLGLPMEDALDAMAKRMDSEDFDFAVTTVNIQRTVGGSLSEILAMVGDTVRGRQQFRKRVKALTSMGSLSAYVLLGMPIFMGMVLSLLNREYMQPLFYTPTGHKLMIAGAFFMTLGYLACMKIVRIKI